MSITLADFKETAGLQRDGWTHERIKDGMRIITWPDTLRGEFGWWWAIGTFEGLWLAGGWALGSVRDRNIDIARGLVPLQARTRAVA